MGFCLHGRILPSKSYVIWPATVATGIHSLQQESPLQTVDVLSLSWLMLIVVAGISRTTSCHHVHKVFTFQCRHWMGMCGINSFTPVSTAAMLRDFLHAERDTTDQEWSLRRDCHDYEDIVHPKSHGENKKSCSPMAHGHFLAPPIAQTQSNAFQQCLILPIPKMYWWSVAVQSSQI